MPRKSTFMDATVARGFMPDGIIICRLAARPQKMWLQRQSNYNRFDCIGNDIESHHHYRPHWHNSKWELFIVVAGHGLIQERKYDMPILYSCHPRSKHRLEKSGFQLDPRVRVNEPLGFNDYNKLQMNALAIVSDSGTLPEESSFYLSIGHPIAAVCIRTSTERPEALEAGDFILAGITTRELLNATDMAIEMKQKGVLGKPCPDYVDETVSMKVVRIIQGYVNVVNKMVWRKY